MNNFRARRFRSKSNMDKLSSNLTFEEYKNRKSTETKLLRAPKKQVVDPEKNALEILRMTPTQYKRYKHAFSLMDINGTGNITKVDFEKILGFFGLANDLSQSFVKECFLNLDRDGDRQFDLNDFLREINDRRMFKFITRLIKGLFSKEGDIVAYRQEIGKLDKGKSLISCEEEENEESSLDYGLSDEAVKANPLGFSRAVLHFEEQDFERYKTAFEMLDPQQKGKLTKSGFIDKMMDYGIGNEGSQEELAFLFQKIDRNSDGEFDFVDFLKSLKKDQSKVLHDLTSSLLKVRESFPMTKAGGFQKKGNYQKDIEDTLRYASKTLKMDDNYIGKLLKVFESLDFNKTNLIPKEDFYDDLQRHGLTKKLRLHEFEKVFDELDFDKDGWICFKDFVNSINANYFSQKAREILTGIFQKTGTTLQFIEKDFWKKEKLQTKGERTPLKEKIQPQIQSEQKHNKENRRIRVQKGSEISLEASEEADIRKNNALKEKDNIINKMRQENLVLRRTKETLHAQISHLQSEIDKANLNAEPVSGGGSRDRMRLIELEETIKMISRDRDAYKKEYEKENKKTNRWREINNMNKEEIVALTGKIETLKNQILSNKMIDENKSSIQFKETQTSQANSPEKRSNEKIRLISENESLKTILKMRDQSLSLWEQEKRKFENRIREMEKERNYNLDKHDLQWKIEELQEKERSYKLQVEELNRKIEDNKLISEESGRLRRENEWLWSQIKDLKQIGNDIRRDYNQESQGQFLEEIRQLKDQIRDFEARESTYNQRVGALSSDIQQYYADVETLKHENMFFQDQVRILQDELDHERRRMDKSGQANLGQANKIRAEMSRLRGEIRNKGLEIQRLCKVQRELEEDYDRMKTGYQNSRIQNLVYEEKINILEREKAASLAANMNSQLRLSYDFSQKDMEALKRQISALKKENIQLRGKIDELRIEAEQKEKLGKGRMSYEISGESDKENISPQRMGGRNFESKALLGKRPKSGTGLEVLKEELKNFREMREGMVSSIYSDRHSQYHKTPPSKESRTPERTDFTKLDKVSYTGQEHEATARKTELNELASRAAPETVKKLGPKPYYFDSVDSNREKESSPKENTEKNREEKLQQISLFAFQVLYWLSDNALLTKELLKLSTSADSQNNEREIKQILEELRVYSEKAKSYFDNNIKSKDAEVRMIYEFVFPLFRKCFQSHESLKKIQNKIVESLKGNGERPTPSLGLGSSREFSLGVVGTS